MVWGLRVCFGLFSVWKVWLNVFGVCCFCLGFGGLVGFGWVGILCGVYLLRLDVLEFCCDVFVCIEVLFCKESFSLFVLGFERGGGIVMSVNVV